MDSEFLQKQLYNSLLAIINDKKLYRVSLVDYKYNEFTDAGKEVLFECIEMFAPKLLESEKQKLDETIKHQVWNTLKEQEHEQSK